MKKSLVIYHGACPDGFCASWVCNMALKDAIFVAGFYGQDPPDVTGYDVVLVDFSYPRAALQIMADQCNSMIVLDHHKTAQEALIGFEHPKVSITFDMKRSGAGIAWDHFFSTWPRRPWLVDYVEDRDLWRFALPDSKEVNEYISTLEYDFETWSAEDRLPITKGVVDFGRVLLRKSAQYIREVAKNARRVTFHGYEVPLVNAPQVGISELGNHLCVNEKFAIGWWQRADGIYQYSLRSIGDFDVSELAKLEGGGGHKNAAGFQNTKFIF